MEKIGDVSPVAQARAVFENIDGKIYTTIEICGYVYFFKRDKIDAEIITIENQEHLVDISDYCFIV